MTNWEKYFGTPERTALTTVERCSSGVTEVVTVYHRVRIIETMLARYYGDWLDSEGDNG